MEPNCFGVTRGVQPLVCNGNDRGQWPKQGGAVGAAACRMRVPSKARSRRREPQPAASRASKVAGAFLVLFWHAKENIPGGDAFCKRHQTLNTRPRFAREALRHFPTQKRSNTCSITASEAFSPVRSHRAASASSTQTETAYCCCQPAAVAQQITHKLVRMARRASDYKSA